MHDRYVHQVRLTTSHDLEDPAFITGFAVQVRRYPDDNWELAANVAFPLAFPEAEEAWGEITKRVAECVKLLPPVLPFE